MLLVRRGDGLPGAGEAFSGAAVAVASVVATREAIVRRGEDFLAELVSGGARTRDAFVAGDFARGRQQAHSATAQRDYTSAGAAGTASDVRKKRNVCD